MFSTSIQQIGPEAELFITQDMMILFGEMVPEELKDYTYIIQVKPFEETIVSGMTLSIDDVDYLITAVGDVVNKNLKELGHITLKFDGSSRAELPGTLYLEHKAIPQINVGSQISIKK